MYYNNYKEITNPYFLLVELYVIFFCIKSKKPINHPLPLFEFLLYLRVSTAHFINSSNRMS